MGYTAIPILEQIGDFIGIFVKLDDRFIGAPWLTYYRIRVSIPVDKPIKQRMKLLKWDKTTCWVNFKYERLHTFCFFCGMLGHSYKFYLRARESAIPVEQYPYSADLRVGGNRGPREIGDQDYRRGSRQRLLIRGKFWIPGPPDPMSTLSWNCRGLGNPRTVRDVVDMVSRKQPDFVFLMKTKVGREHAEQIRVTIGFEGLFYVNNNGLSGGLALFWRKNSTTRLLSYSTNYVDIEVTITGHPAWWMTCYYGFSERTRRTKSWDLLRALAAASNLPWTVMGDFNDLLFQHEKRGGNSRPNSLLRGFGDALEDCGLAQLPMAGYPYTWEKGNGTVNWIEERLDKVLVTNEWRNIVPHAKVTNLRTRKSDHSALFLGIHESLGTSGTGRRGF
ncbi:PREDICTED: uncharacterized protein LOC109166988 [Ipomoea nil]|uniref:uncharacterized protein LOC109166988 n=1 Tax=Ipomoea nil TaxID=35883 RepID=UPI000901AAA5|nr:PREDICTED: uncharacterized protein LOC109166988 [Ipomoea nil]